MGVERAIDGIVFVILIAAMIQTPSNFMRAALGIACVMILLGWFIAWRRQK
jgi:uncharacterized membrane protein YobD (UPF0266 family)